MPHPLPIQFSAPNLEALASHPGRIAVFAQLKTPLSPALRKLDRLMRGALARCIASESFAKLKPGEGIDLAFPTGLAAEALHLLHLPKRTDLATARKAGGAIGRAHGTSATLVLAESHPRAAHLLWPRDAGIRILGA